MHTTHADDEISTPLPEPRKQSTKPIIEDTDTMGIFAGQSEWPCHVESIQDELQMMQDQIHQMQRQECKYSFKAGTSKANSASSKSVSAAAVPSSNFLVDEWRQKICEWMFAITDHFDLDRELATIAMHFLDQSYHQPHIRQKLWSSLQEERKTQGTTALKCNKTTAALLSPPWLMVVQQDTNQFYRWIAVTSLYMAVKLYSPRRFRVRVFCQLARKTMRSNDIFTMERHMLQALDWKLHPPTALHYVTLSLRFLLLTFYKTKTNSQHQDCVDTDDTDDEDELLDAQVWQGMVHSYKFLSDTAQYLTEAMVFMHLPWKKHNARVDHTTSVWAIAALWCALELYQVRSLAEGADEDDEDDNCFSLWQDLIWHHLLPLLDLQWNAVQQVCRLLRPVLSIHQDHFGDESFQTIGGSDEAPLCDDTRQFGGKKSPTSVMEGHDQNQPQHFGKRDSENHADGANPMEMSTVESTLCANPIPTTLWCSKREAMMRLALDSKRQKRATEGECRNHDSTPYGMERQNNRTAQAGRFTERGSRKHNPQPTVAVAISAESRVPVSSHLIGVGSGNHNDVDKSHSDGPQPLMRCGVVIQSQSLCASNVQVGGFTNQSKEKKSKAGVDLTLRRPIPRRATTSDDLSGIGSTSHQNHQSN